ncbi:NADP oxidoreductase coenzyme F420-dependent [Acidovorax delafieldii 2AN]|uniref:NADP oxidoreductase coenzyme F420-dependent n=1 Tax=Acidovorax delafieldii 2AN TaxID=573060 RepID=C5T3U6_ACIDE|nr:NADPH-dependent F420 reductase [Acidovorax delafieldii]EER60867.1 NADP oxidoreductase coenzyme F420-dependent [Acidovorax delafieldii 2AN]
MSISRRSALGVLAGLAAFPALLPLKGWAAESLRIGVIGAGWLGGTVGRSWVRAGHEVMFSARDLDKVRADIAGLGAKASVGSPQQAAAFGSVLLFAVPYDALPDLGRDLAASLRGKVVLDACNPPPGSTTPLTRDAEEAGVGLMSARLLPGARLVRAFSAVDATAIESSAGRSSGKLGVPLAGDDDDAVQVAARLVRDAGCEPVIVGDLKAARSFQRGGPGFRANTTAPELRRRMGLSDRS